MAKILIVDDEMKIRSIVRKYAEYEGHEVREAADGREAVSVCASESFDVIVLDVMLPELDGYSVLRQIRKSTDTPVIMLSALGEEYDRIKGFELGVDDYVIKPFSPKELMLRISVAVKRGRAESAQPGQECCCRCEEHEVYCKEGMQVDLSSRKLTVDGEKKELTYKAFELLEYFIRNRNIALSRDQIITAVWGYDYCGDDRTLDTHIKFLRCALGPYRNCIVTVRNVGYRFEEK